MANLLTASGVRVSVADEKVDRYLAAGGYRRPDDGSDAGSAAEGYSAMKVADLKAEIGRRNEGREEADLLSAEGKKADLVAALEADDAARSDEE